MRCKPGCVHKAVCYYPWASDPECMSFSQGTFPQEPESHGKLLALFSDVFGPDYLEHKQKACPGCQHDVAELLFMAFCHGVNKGRGTE
jgi:hypothetical protein